jgi:hypothetical protein
MDTATTVILRACSPAAGTNNAAESHYGPAAFANMSRIQSLRVRFAR